MSKISVIVPVYNVESTLCKCIDSILKQTYDNWELLLIDDGSTDSSGGICDIYAEKDCRISVVHKVNGGVSVARNTGLDKACGKYVLFVDSDDYIDENALEILLKNAEENDADVVMFGFYYHVEETKETFSNFPEVHFVGNESEFLEEVFEHTFRKEMLNAPWNKLIRKNVLDANNLRFNPEFSICEDMIFSIEILSVSNQIVVLDKAMYHYVYKLGDNLVNKFHYNYFEALNFYKKKMDSYLAKNDAEESIVFMVEDFYAEKIIAYLKRIYVSSRYDRKKKYSELKRIGNHSEVQHVMKRYCSVRIKKKVVVFCINNKFFVLLNLLYLVLSLYSKVFEKRG